MSPLVGGLVGGCFTLLVVLMGIVLNRLSRIEDKLDGKVDKETLEKFDKKCAKATADIWGTLNHHAHNGGDRVVRT